MEKLDLISPAREVTHIRGAQKVFEVGKWFGMKKRAVPGAGPWTCPKQVLLAVDRVLPAVSAVPGQPGPLTAGQRGGTRGRGWEGLVL